MKQNEVAIRRARIANYLDDNKTIGFDQPALVAKELGLDSETVRNDMKFLREKYREENKKYNLEGLFRGHKEKVKRLEELQKLASENIKSGETVSEKNQAISLEADLINTIYHLENDGLTPIAEELERREELKTKKNA